MKLPQAPQRMDSLWCAYTTDAAGTQQTDWSPSASRVCSDTPQRSPISAAQVPGLAIPPLLSSMSFGAIER